MKANVDLNALKQLSKIELFLLLCGAVTVTLQAAEGQGMVRLTSDGSDVSGTSCF